MTNQEAITKLTNIMHDDHYAWHPSILAAFDMAVDALKGADGDSISKQVLKETFVETSLLEWEQLKKCYPMLEVVDELPSAQPELGKNSPSEQHKMDKLGVKTEETCTDTISRAEAIDVLDVGAEVWRRVLDDVDVVGNEREKYEWGLDLIESYIVDMKELPSAQPEHNPDDERKIADLHKMVNYLLSQPEQRWIPVTERLPEVGAYVLISKKALNFRSNLPNVCTAHRSCDPRSGKEEWNDMLFGKLDDDDVLAWMPLPEPYREEGENGENDV